MDVTHCSVAELAAKLQNKEISAVEVAQQYLDRIEAHKDLNAFLDVRPEETLRQAEAAAGADLLQLGRVGIKIFL